MSRVAGEVAVEPRMETVVAGYRMATRKRLGGPEASQVAGHSEARQTKMMPRW
jgi:hypothetical protein